MVALCLSSPEPCELSGHKWLPSSVCGWAQWCVQCIGVKFPNYPADSPWLLEKESPYYSMNKMHQRVESPEWRNYKNKLPRKNLAWDFRFVNKSKQ